MFEMIEKQKQEKRKQTKDLEGRKKGMKNWFEKWSNL